ncbi:MAG: c-type cytochrome [Caulobacteraceae bacterium]
MRPSRALIVGLAAAAAATAAFAQGNPVNGKAAFEAQCSGCHSVSGPSFAGPSLEGVYGRQAGTAAGFQYSDAMKKSGVTWTNDSLNVFLADPNKLVPGTIMPVNVPDPQQRDDIVEYLRSLKGQ